MRDWLELDAAWYGPVTYRRVVDGDFTAGMLDIVGGLYLWGAKRDDEYRALYVGKADAPAERQRAHLTGTVGRNLKRIRSQRWDPLFWAAYVAFPERLLRQGDAAIEALELAERALIYAAKPEWNRASAGYIADLPANLILRNSGRRPPDVRSTIRLRAGTHA